MESKVNLAVVGAFVLVLTASGIGGLLWLGSGRLSHKPMSTYAASFSDSVAGLSPRAPVKLRGVDVGTVEAIALEPDDSARVRVLLALENGTPVKEDTYATIETQGLTGIAYVELGGGSHSAPALRARAGDPLPVISTRPSVLRRLDVAATSLLGNFDRVATGLNETLDANTRQALRRSAADLARILETLSRRSREIDDATAAAAVMLKNGARASVALPATVERLGRSADALERMGNEFAQVAVSAGAAFEEARGTIGLIGNGVERFDTEVVPDVQGLVADLRETSASLGRVGAELERDPSIAVLGRSQPPPGPGE